jgi:hypothetical protein
MGAELTAVVGALTGNGFTEATGAAEAETLAAAD